MTDNQKEKFPSMPREKESFSITAKDLIKIDEFTYEIPKSYRADMKVPARVYTNDQLLPDILSDRALWQLVNMTTLPGIQGSAFAMPDIHQGYGFPIGGVAAIDAEHGIISPGGIGYDINCGVRLLAATMTAEELKPHLEKLATRLYHTVPSGVGKGGKLVQGERELEDIFVGGAQAMLKRGFGEHQDIALCEENGSLAYANPDLISAHARARGADQIGTLGSGNHFLEVQVVDEIFDPIAAAAYGLSVGQVTVMIHCGSRGLGHQVCTDSVRTMMHKLPEWGYDLPDRELIYAPFNSPEGQDYWYAMGAAANYAWANRHMIAHGAREAWREVIGDSVKLNMVYDLSHNVGKLEEHMINGVKKNLIMHRKGATRAFGPGSIHIPEAYRAIGQPVLIPGTMGTASYVLAGTSESMDVAFGSSCHGAGRRLSRIKAEKMVRGSQVRNELADKGIIVRSGSVHGLAQEAPLAYKDIEEVINVVHGAHLARKVARLRPLAVIKGE